MRGLPVEDLWTTSALIAAMRPPLEALVAVSMALRRLSRFDRRDLAGSRAREEARRILLELVAQGEDAGAYGMGRARGGSSSRRTPGPSRGRLWTPQPDSGNEARRIHVRADPVAQAWRPTVGAGPVPRDW